MIIFIYGEDDYSSRRKLEEIIFSYKSRNKSGLAPIIIDCPSLKKEKSDSLLEEIFSRQSIFGGKKLVVFKNLFQSQLKELVFGKKTVLSVSAEVFVFWENGNVLTKEPLFGFFKKEAKVQKFDRLNAKKLENWIAEEIALKKSSASLRAITVLSLFLGNNLWRLSEEINKLVAYKKGARIEEKDVISLIKPAAESAVFELLDAFAEKNKKKAVLLLKRRLEGGDSPLYLLSMLAFQTRNLLIVKSLTEKAIPYYGLAKIAGIHPFAAKKAYLQSPKFSLGELKKIQQKIFLADIGIKKGMTNPETALSSLAADFCL